MTSTNRATVLVILAYCWWGLSAIFWRSLGDIAPIDLLSWRVVLGFVYLSGVWVVRRRHPFAGIDRRHIAYGMAAALLIGANWAGFLWAVDNDQAVEAALGYFLMPVFAVMLGVGVLGERLSQMQKVALGFALLGIAWTFLVLGSVPWIALLLGSTFAGYGLVKKQGPWEAVEGLTFETAILSPFALGVLVVHGLGAGRSIGDGGSASDVVLIALTGLVTIVPLMLFSSAAKRVSLTAVGLLQYINPTLQFLVGWQVFGEVVSLSYLAGFVWIWVALVLIVIDQLRPHPVATRSLDRR